MPPENQNLEDAPQPTATQEPTEPVPIPPSTSAEIAMPPVAPESPTEAGSAIPVNNDNPQIEPEIIENNPAEQPAPADAEAVADGQTENISSNQPLSEAPEIPTAHSARNEPLLKSIISSVVGNTAKQERVKKKLENIIEFLNTKGKVTNDEVEKLLHVSDATATRYLSQLEKEGKIKQEGRTGKSVSYSRI